MRNWLYRARMFSRKGGHVFQATRCLDEYEYAIPEARALAEQIAQDQLRAVEGYGPDIEIESLGWHAWDYEYKPSPAADSPSTP